MARGNPGFENGPKREKEREAMDKRHARRDKEGVDVSRKKD